MLQLVFSPFPLLTTGRVVMKPITGEDESALYRLRSDDEVNRYLDRPKARTIDDIRKFIDKISLGISNRELLYWGIYLQNNGALIGTACLWNISIPHQSVEIGYELIPAYQGQGYMQEALAKLLEYCFKTAGAQKVEAVAHKDNDRSSSLLRKLGFDRDPGREKQIAETEKMDNIHLFALDAGGYERLIQQKKTAS